MTPLTFTEFEPFADAVQEASMTMRMTSLEEPKWTLRYASAGPLRVQQGYEGGGNIAEGMTFSEGWTFYHQPRPFHANGEVATPDDVFVAPPNGEFCLACQPSHQWTTVAVPASLLFPSSPEREPAVCDKPHLLKPPAIVTRQFTSLIERFLSTVELEPLLLDAPVALDAYRYELIAAARELFSKSEHPASGHFERWYQQTKSTIDLAMSDPGQSLSIAELARREGVPERTLRTAFQRCYGLSPLEFLRIQRLHQARQLLLSGSPDETTVTRIAFGLGFWDLGRFAGAYRRLFQERPAVTLRKPEPGSSGGKPDSWSRARLVS